MSFMDKAKKNLNKAGIENGTSSPPTFWVSTGNYAQNKIISGSFLKGIPQGRITAFAGPSGAGKSFNVVNLMREAQHEGCHVVAIDSENALDDDFVSKLGVDTAEDQYSYFGVSTVSECKKIVSSVMTSYLEDNKKHDPDAEKVLIAIDSLTMLMTDAELEQFKKGESRGDMGQKNKQLKAMLQSFTNSIKGTNVIIVLTSQVYANQDFPMNGKPQFIFPAAVEYCCSQIIMVTKLNLKDKTTKEISGVRMKCVGQKTRFCKPNSSITMMVPYEEGMNPYSGLLEIAVGLEVVSKNGAWYTHESTGNKFQEAKFDKYAEDVLQECEKLSVKGLEAILEDGEVDAPPDTTKSAKQQRADIHSDNAE